MNKKLFTVKIAASGIQTIKNVLTHPNNVSFTVRPKGSLNLWSLIIPAIGQVPIIIIDEVGRMFPM